MNIPSKIQEAIDNNRLVVFAGSGLSSKFGLPSWKDMVKSVIEMINKEHYNVFLPVLEIGAMKPIEILERLSLEHNEIQKYIKSNFQIKGGDFKLHEDIIKLSGQIITTNFDNAFEVASGNTIVPATNTSQFNISEINKTGEKYIFKLHGSYSEPDHCVVFKEQYEDLYLNETAAKEKLKSIFTDRLILFIGFSFNDPDINLIFSNLDKAFGNNNKHFILTNEPDNFKTFNFLESIAISDFVEIDTFIKACLDYKEVNQKPNLKNVISTNSEKEVSHKIAILIPNPIDLKIDDELQKVYECFDTIDSEIQIGSLNIKTLEKIDDFDLLVIASKVFKNKLYIEDDNLKSNLLSLEEICSNVINDRIPIVFITNELIEPINNRSTINISTFRRPVIKRFVYKYLREGRVDFPGDNDITINILDEISTKWSKGQPKITSLYNNNINLEIGKKCLTSVVGRIEEQSSIALRLINNNKTNRLLNIKASGGTGKTTIIKKVAYELYNRGYYSEGVSFKSCESVKTYADLEEIIISGFNLTNILNFKEHLLENYSFGKIDLLIILDNFETVVNNLEDNELSQAIELLKYATDYANIVITSRERLSPVDDFEDVYSLTPLITDDALVLFQKYYGVVNDDEEIKILRNDILEDMLNNNPLAIKLVTKSRTRSKYITELRDQLKEHFFESINEDYSLVFKNNADLNIERTKSIYQSINYSYTTLNNKEKIAFELLSLFPDGISLSNFKKCFEKSNSSNRISDNELRIIRDKSLVEDYNGILQLQPIIRRFADYQFLKRSVEIKSKYCLDAYVFNCYLLDVIEFIEKKRSTSEALKVYNSFKNNLLNVLSYIPFIELDKNEFVPEKKYLLNFVYSMEDFVVSEKQVNEFHDKLDQLQSFFSDLPNANTLIKVLDLNKTYYHQEFDNSYLKLSELLSIEEMESRIFSNEDYIEKRYKNIISNIHSMEGFTIQRMKSLISNKFHKTYLDSHFFYLGIVNNISREKDGFYYFEYELMFKRLNIKKLEDYIKSLHSDQHLEIMQSTYTLSKVMKIESRTIQKLVVTNPYTKGLKELMFAFIAKNSEEKIGHFDNALMNLSHIKYYYLEALYYYCVFLKDVNEIDYKIKLKEGINLSRKFYYQYLSFLFSELECPKNKTYEFTYSYYPIVGLEEYVNTHNAIWEKFFRENNIE